MNIVLFAPSGAVESALRQLAPDAASDHVTVVSRSTPDAGGVHAIVLRPGLSALTRRAERALGGSAAGRNVLRLSPLDAGRRSLRSRASRPATARPGRQGRPDRGTRARWHSGRLEERAALGPR